MSMSPEARAQYQRRYYQQNKERLIEYQRQYAKRHPEKRKKTPRSMEQQKRYRAKYKQRMREVPTAVESYSISGLQHLATDNSSKFEKAVNAILCGDKHLAQLRRVRSEEQGGAL